MIASASCRSIRCGRRQNSRGKRPTFPVSEPAVFHPGQPGNRAPEGSGPLSLSSAPSRVPDPRHFEQERRLVDPSNGESRRFDTPPRPLEGNSPGSEHGDQGGISDIKNILGDSDKESNRAGRREFSRDALAFFGRRNRFALPPRSIPELPEAAPASPWCLHCTKALGSNPKVFCV